MRGRWQALCGAVAAAAAIHPGGSFAQTYPGKPVRYVIPFDAGSSPDIVGRTIGERLTRLWGQQVVVDNRVGAAGTLGSAFVAKAAPDGYTLLQANIASNAISVSLYAKMPYDQLRDFAPITRIGMTPNVIMVHPSTPFRTVRQMVDYAKAHPGKLSYSASLPGTSPHLTIELLKLQLKFDIVYIPYKLGAQAVTDTIGGQVPINISNGPLSTGPVQSGRLRALAVTSAQRLPLLPDVPTMKESGVPNFEVTSWYGLMAPAGTPAAILDKINADMQVALHSPEVEKRMQDVSMPPSPTTRQEFDQFVRNEIARWARVIKEAGIPQQ
ncbi:MAG TPA: tripartite tricarboxylate transporter substrate binding protein [Burkholderiales bacterium]|nr:tripartite tricarboxylate transporter substrate binding protein [Burkholderiales bacterium]